jgi:NAD(P)H-dependent FMN reductase
VPHLQIIVGTTRPGRFSEKVAQWVVEHVAARDDVSSELIDLRDYPLPFFDQLPPAYTLRDYPTEAAATFGATIDQGDGYIILTGEYNHGYPAVLKNAIDHSFVEWRRKPVSFVGWGNVGGARAIEQLREVVVELEMAPLRHAVHILPELMVPVMQASEPFDTGLFSALDPKLTALVDDLLWWTTTLATGRALDA